MAVDSINSSGAAYAGAAPPVSAGSGSESEQRFLKLLVTQLNNQDPLNPLDNAQLTSQLAQMSTVSGIEKLNSAFEAMLAQSGSSQVLQSASMIGRTVLVPGSNLTLEKGSNVAFGIDMSGSAESVVVNITNAAGDTVRRFDLGAVLHGVKTLSWDGLTDDGTAVDSGSYALNVIAANGESKIASKALIYSKVSSVSQQASGVALDLATGGKATLSDVRLIL